MKEFPEPTSEESEEAENSLAPRLSFTENFSRWLRRQHLLDSEGKKEEKDNTPSGRLSRILRRLRVFVAAPVGQYNSPSAERQPVLDSEKPQDSQFLDSSNETTILSPYLVEDNDFDQHLGPQNGVDTIEDSSESSNASTSISPDSPLEKASRQDSSVAEMEIKSQDEDPLMLPVAHHGELDNNPQDIQQVDLGTHEMPTFNDQVVELHPSRQDEQTTAPEQPVARSRHFPLDAMPTQLPENIGRTHRAEELAALGLVGVGLESTARRRADRKIRKDLATTRKDVKRNEVRTQQLEEVVSRPPMTTERPEIWQQAFETQRPIRTIQTPERSGATARSSEKQPRVPIEKPIESLTEKQKVPSIEKLPKVQRLAPKLESAEMPTKASTLESLLHSREILKKPEIVLKKIEQAVEENVAIERLYERRHEVKDEPQATMVAISATSAATITPPVFSEHSSQAQAVTQPSRTQSQLSANTVAGQTKSYRQAVQNGFLGALAVLAALFFITFFI